MPYLRLTRDQRGYENTFLLHVAHPGERPRVLYWYRTAPGVRVGRPPLDEAAIRTIEERHPDIEFDWPHILESGENFPPEIEPRPERPRRKAGRPREEAREVEALASPVVEPPVPAADLVPADVASDIARVESAEAEGVAEEPAPARSQLLESLVGREIATRLRARHAEIVLRIHRAGDHPLAAVWHARAEKLDPDNWVTPEAVLHGVQHADAHFDDLRREVLAAIPPEPH